jgi:hypothetical protein
MTKTLTIDFSIDLEEKDRAQFQKEGHMLFGLYGPGATPDDPPIRRPWEGDKVFIATLFQPSDVGPLAVRERTQVLRVMSDSAERALAGLQQGIRLALYANARERARVDFDYQQFLACNEQSNRLSEFIQAEYAAEIAEGKHAGFANVFDVAMHYLKKGKRLGPLAGRKVQRKRK